MENEIKTSIVVDLKGNLDRQLKQNEANINRFTRNSSRSFMGLGKNVKGMNRTFVTMGKKIAGIAAAATIIRGINKTIEFDAKLTQLRTDGKMNAKELEALKKKIFEVANMRDVRLDPNDLTATAIKIIASTGDKKFVMDNMRNIGLTQRASGASGISTGDAFAKLYDGGIKNADKIREAINNLVEQGKSGAFTFADTANYGSKLFAPYLGLGFRGSDAFTDMNAIAQISVKAVGGEAEVPEATSALIKALMGEELQDKLAASGINVRNEDGSYNRLPQLMLDIYKASGNDTTKIKNFLKLDDSATKVFTGLSLPGNVELLKKFMTMKSSGGELEESARINASTAKAAKQSLSNKYDKGMDFIFSGPTKDFARGLDTFERQGALANANSAAEFFFDQFNVLADWTVGSIIRGTSGTKGFINNDEQPEARVILEIESKNATVKTKEIKTKGLQVDVDSALSVGGVK